MIEQSLFLYWGGDKFESHLKLEHNRMPLEGTLMKDERQVWFENRMNALR